MRISRVLLAAVLTVGAATGVAVSATTSQAAGTDYYVALGDSLSVGYQPGGDTNQGYTDDLYNVLKGRDPNLQLVKLGCSGETTGSMISGGVCTDGRYTTGSQLGDAVAFLTAHKANVKYLTLDIGANDVDGCTPGGSIDAPCLVTGTLTIAKNLNTILSKLKAADGGLPSSTGMMYYDPFLEYWLNGAAGQLVATASVALLDGINTAEALAYSAYGFHIADASAAFKSSVFLPIRNTPPYGNIPPNVAFICQYTYMCSVQNIHANPAGYQLIANVFAAHI